MTNRNVPLRGIADSTKHESAPPANNPTSLTDPLGLDSGNPADPCNDPGYTDARCPGPPTQGCSWVGDPNCCAGPDIGGDNAELCDPMIGDLPPPIQWNPLPPIIPPTAAGQLGALGFEPGAGTLEQALPYGGEIGVLVEACGLNPVACAAAVGTVGVIGLGAYELYKYVRPTPAASVPQAPAKAQPSAAGLKFEVCTNIPGTETIDPEKPWQKVCYYQCPTLGIKTRIQEAHKPCEGRINFGSR